MAEISFFIQEEGKKVEKNNLRCIPHPRPRPRSRPQPHLIEYAKK
jgi:hypothetical protein